MELKYNIKESMLSLPVMEYKRMRREIPKALKKNIRTFDRYINLAIDEFGDIPALDLDIIASFLSCSADELKNYMVDNCRRKKRIIRTK